MRSAGAILLVVLTGTCVLIGTCLRAQAGTETPPASSSSPEPDRDGQIITELGYLVTAANLTAPSKINVRDDLNRSRGGNDSAKPLGCYTCNAPLIYRSIYPSEPSGIIAAWTYDLHHFIQQEEGVTTDMRSTRHDLDKLPDYKTVRDKFALDWWKSHSTAFGALLPPSQSGFLYDAIVDGVNIWSRYELLSNMSSADGVVYNDALLNTYRNAPSSKIFF